MKKKKQILHKNISIVTIAHWLQFFLLSNIKFQFWLLIFSRQACLCLCPLWRVFLLWRAWIFIFNLFGFHLKAFWKVFVVFYSFILFKCAIQFRRPFYILWLANRISETRNHYAASIVFKYKMSKIVTRTSDTCIKSNARTAEEGAKNMIVKSREKLKFTEWRLASKNEQKKKQKKYHATRWDKIRIKNKKKEISRRKTFAFISTWLNVNFTSAMLN